jgi:excisionase family DNA binding protein
VTGERLLTSAELAERLDVPTGWPLEQARAGTIPHVRLGRYVRFQWEDVAAWLESVKVGGGRTFRRHRPRGGTSRVRTTCSMLSQESG